MRTLIFALLTALCAQPLVFAQTLSFVSPTGGEVYVIGQTQTIRLAGHFKTADIELSADGGATFTKVGTIDNSQLARVDQNTLKFTVADPVSVLCQFRATVTNVRNAPPSATSGMFTITDKIGGASATNTTVVTGLPDGGVTNAKLAAGAVTADKISSGNAPNAAVLMADGSGKANFAMLPGSSLSSGAASAGMVLTADGGGAASFSSINGSEIIGKVAAAVSADTAATANSALTAVSFSGSLSGDVSGPQAATTVGRLAGVPLSTAAPTNGQVLQFNATAGRWQPSSLSSGPILSISGTPNQINAVNNGGNVTLSAPQNIDAGAAPTFQGINTSAASFSGNASGQIVNADNSGAGPAANFNTAGQTAVNITGGNGPADVATLEVTGNTADGVHALTLGTSRSGIFAEARAVGSYGIVALSSGTMGQGRAGMFVGYSRDGYAVEIRNGSTDAGGGGALLVDQEGTTNNIAVFQSQKNTRVYFDNAGVGHFPKLTVGNAAISSGTGSPNGAVTGSVGDLFLRTDGGAGSTLWVKESGSGTTSGWVAK